MAKLYKGPTYLTVIQFFGAEEIVKVSENGGMIPIRMVNPSAQSVKIVRKSDLPR